jgi:hypothetical protein
MTPSTPVFGAVLALIAWRIYKRIRRNIGRQPLRPRRALTSIIILSVLSVVILYQTGLFIHSRDKNVSDQKSFELGGSNLDSSCDRS